MNMERSSHRKEAAIDQARHLEIIHQKGPECR